MPKNECGDETRSSELALCPFGGFGSIPTYLLCDSVELLLLELQKWGVKTQDLFFIICVAQNTSLSPNNKS